MPTWVIQTGEESWTATGRNCFDAARKAWKARPPKSVGVLVQLTPDGRESETRYSLGDVALRKAGFDCPEVSVEEYAAAIERPGKDSEEPCTACEHRDLHFLGRNAGVYCRFCGATWRRRKVEHRSYSHLMLTNERQADGVLHAD